MQLMPLEGIRAPMNTAALTANATALTVRDPWSLVPSLGNLESYVSAVNRMPMLTQAEEVQLGPGVADGQGGGVCGQDSSVHIDSDSLQGPQFHKY